MPVTISPRGISPLEAVRTALAYRQHMYRQHMYRHRSEARLPQEVGTTSRPFPTGKPTAKASYGGPSHAVAAQPAASSGSERLPMHHPFKREFGYHTSQQTRYYQAYNHHPQQFTNKIQISFGNKYFTLAKPVYDQINSVYQPLVKDGKLVNDQAAIKTAETKLKALQKNLTLDTDEYKFATNIIHTITGKQLRFVATDEFVHVGVTPEERAGRIGLVDTPEDTKYPVKLKSNPHAPLQPRHEAGRTHSIRPGTNKRIADQRIGKPSNPMQGKGARPDTKTQNVPAQGMVKRFISYLFPAKSGIKDHTKQLPNQYTQVQQLRDIAVTALNKNDILSFNYYTNQLINIASYRDYTGNSQTNETSAHARAILNELSSAIDDAQRQSRSPEYKKQLSSASQYINYALDNLLNNEKAIKPR